jgi:MurNAc alpha-1-phosphate uridylyltransferase
MIQAVVLAGGLGTRLGALGTRYPKVLQPVHGRPFIDYLLAHFVRHGVTRFHFALGHLAPQVRDHLETRWQQLNMTMSVEREPLGTAGALAACVEQLDEVFLLSFGDTFLPADPIPVVRSLEPNDWGVLAVSSSAHDAPPNVLFRGDRVRQYHKRGIPAEAQDQDGSRSGVDAGWAVLRRDVLDKVRTYRPPTDLETLHRLIIAEGRMRHWRVEGFFYDIGTPERLDRFARSPWAEDQL